MKTALDLRAVATLIVLCGSWGLNQVAIKVTLWGIPPALQMGARSTVAALLVFGWCVLRGKKLFRPDGSLWPGLAVGILFGLEFLAVFLGLQRTTASRAVIFIYLSPFVVALGGHFLLGETLGPRKLVGLGLCLPRSFARLLRRAFAAVERRRSSAIRSASSPPCFGARRRSLIKGSVLSEVSAEKTLLYQLAVSAVLGLALSSP